MNAYLDGIGDERRRGAKRELPELSTPKVVVYHVIRCPVCNSTRVPVYCSDYKPVRYHKCRDCKATFKSIEKL